MHLGSAVGGAATSAYSRRSSDFETGRQNHTEDPVTIAGIVVFRQERERSVFGADVPAMKVPMGQRPLAEPIPPGRGVRDNGQEGTSEAQVWGPLQVTADQVQAIMVEVASVHDPDLVDLRFVAERQGIPLVVRVLGGPEMTQVLLCGGPGLLVTQKDGLLFYRRPGPPDAPVPYAHEHYSVFLRSARQKHGLTPVFGSSGEEAPFLSEESALPAVRRERLSTGDEVYRLVSTAEEASQQGRRLGRA